MWLESSFQTPERESKGAIDGFPSVAIYAVVSDEDDAKLRSGRRICRHEL